LTTAWAAPAQAQGAARLRYRQRERIPFEHDWKSLEFPWWSHFLRRTGFHPRIESEGMLLRKMLWSESRFD